MEEERKIKKEKKVQTTIGKMQIKNAKNNNERKTKKKEDKMRNTKKVNK